MKELTERQKEVLAFISDYTKENVCPPTVREIGSHFGISLRAVQDHIAALQKKGFLSQSQKKSRSIRVLSEIKKEEGPFTARVPILGTITAGIPLFSEENFSGSVNMAEPFVKPEKEYFALKVRGQSMVNAGILEGDIAVLEKAEFAEDGQIVLALLDDSITLKRFYRESDRVRLQPENPEFQAVYSQNAKVVGLLAAVVRSY